MSCSYLKMLSQLICYTALNEKWEIDYVSLKDVIINYFIVKYWYFFGGIEENHKTSVRTTGFLVDIQIRNLLNACGWSYDHLLKPKSYSVNLQVQIPMECSAWHENICFFWILMYSKLIIIWYPSISNSHATSKKSKKIYHFKKLLQKQIVTHICSPATQQLSQPGCLSSSLMQVALLS